MLPAALALEFLQEENARVHSKKHRVVSSRYIYAISFKYKKEILLWINKLKVIAVKHINCFKAKIHFTLIPFFRPWCKIFLDLDARYFVCTLDQVTRMHWPKVWFFECGSLENLRFCLHQPKCHKPLKNGLILTF